MSVWTDAGAIALIVNGTLIPSGIYAFKKAKKYHKDITVEVTTDVIDTAIKPLLDDMIDSHIEPIRKEIQLNGGGSLKDTVVRLVSEVNELRLSIESAHILSTVVEGKIIDAVEGSLDKDSDT